MQSKLLPSMTPEGLLSNVTSRPPSPSPSQLQHAAEGLRLIQSETLAIDESMHVSYEDPRQRTEKEKLLMLLEGGQNHPAKPPDLRAEQDIGGKRNKRPRKDVRGGSS